MYLKKCDNICSLRHTEANKKRRQIRTVYYFEHVESSSKSFTEINLEASFIQSSICNTCDKKTFKLVTKTKTIPDVLFFFIRFLFHFAIRSRQIKEAKYKALPASYKEWNKNKKKTSTTLTHNNTGYAVQWSAVCIWIVYKLTRFLFVSVHALALSLTLLLCFFIVSCAVYLSKKTGKM